MPCGTSPLVTVTDTNNCVWSDSAFVYMQQYPTISDWDTTIIIGQYVVLDAFIDSSFTYSWFPTDNLLCPDCPITPVQPLSDPIVFEEVILPYVVTLKDTLGCFEEKYKYSVTVRPETSLEMPTAFTPNGDENNDIVYVKGWGIKDLLEYKIYNRWGQLVFETDDINIGWDGTWKGKKQNTDTYVYHVKVFTYLDTVLFKKGYINLIR